MRVMSVSATQAAGPFGGRRLIAARNAFDIGSPITVAAGPGDRLRANFLLLT